jgi:hypothetical protein
MEAASDAHCLTHQGRRIADHMNEQCTVLSFGAPYNMHLQSSTLKVSFATERYDVVQWSRYSPAWNSAWVAPEIRPWGP